MKKLFIFIYAVASYAGAQIGMTVLPSGKIDYPSNFIEANNIALKTDLPTLFPLSAGVGLSGEPYSGSAAQTWNVDQAWLAEVINANTPKQYPTFIIETYGIYYDAEVKAMDFGAVNRLWISTTKNAENALLYDRHPNRDANAKIYFHCADTAFDNRAPIPFFADIFNSLPEQAKAMSGLGSVPTIGGILIQPNIDGHTQGGANIGDMFRPDSGLAFSAIRLTLSDFERSNAGNVLYRAAPVTYAYPKLGNAGWTYILKDEQFEEGWGVGSYDYVQSAEIITDDAPPGLTRSLKLRTRSNAGNSHTGNGYRKLGFFEIGATYDVVMSVWLKRAPETVNSGMVGIASGRPAFNIKDERGIEYKYITNEWQKFSFYTRVEVLGTYVGILTGASSTEYNTVLISGLTIAIKKVEE